MQQVHSVFTELCQDLRRLKDLPLSITSLQGASPTFRYTEVGREGRRGRGRGGRGRGEGYSKSS